MQSGSYQIQNLLRILPRVLHILGCILPDVPMVRFGSYTPLNHLFLIFLQTSSESAQKIGKLHHKLNPLTAVPCCCSNFNHQPQTSPRSGLILTARSNHCLAFSIFRSAQNRRATVQIINGSSADFLNASADRDFRVGRGSDQIAMDHRRPEVGHS